MADIDRVLELAQLKSPTKKGGAFVFTKVGWRRRGFNNLSVEVGVFVCDILME